MRYLTTLVLFCISLSLFSQSNYWQQRVDYKMDIDFDVKTNQFKGKQKLTLYNNSPDTLYKAFYHLYFNAFQPGSVMDNANQNYKDPDKRLDKIPDLTPAEQGYQKVNSLSQNGKAVSYKIVGTILEVDLNEPIAPNKKAVFEMDFDAQVPLQTRRSGRDNEEGIEYSMSQWYPKMCEYDRHGWHANEYIGREFYGIWGDYEVNITLDSAYTIGGTGYLQNAQEIGHGYQNPDKKVKRPDGAKLTWKFNAPNVHDFVWAADPDYVVENRVCENGTVLYFVYQPDSITTKTWPKLGEYMEKSLNWMNSHYGVYPYKQYSFIQGGDGGMEYPMATLITGKRGFSSLVGVSVHEMNHSWFQGVLAFDESHYGWMDEGFTTYASEEVMKFLGYGSEKPLFWNGFNSYLALEEAHEGEPLSTHADFFNSNRAYGVSVYNKGGVFLHQLRYIVGETNFRTGMQRFFNEWKFKHPTDVSLKRAMEKTSGLELDWYFEQFVYSTNTIDYAITSLYTTNANTQINLKRKGRMMMPVEVLVRYADGTDQLFYIPLVLMRGEKTELPKNATTLPDWDWTEPNYTITIDGKKEVALIFIDPSYSTADTDRDNNILQIEQGTMLIIEK